MKKIVATLFTILLISPAEAQDKKVFLNFFTGVASFKTNITHIEGNNFQPTTLYSIAPTGLRLDIELLKNLTSFEQVDELLTKNIDSVLKQVAELANGRASRGIEAEIFSWLFISRF